jgi:hypothetical protein
MSNNGGKHTMTNSLHLIKHEAPSARDNLQAAIEALESAELAHAKSVEAQHARAQTMHDAAKADVTSFDHLDATVSAHNAGELRLAIATGSASPDLSQLPEHLSAAKAKRALAVEKLDAIRDVHAELARDLQTSEKAVERRKYELDFGDRGGCRRGLQTLGRRMA